MNFSKLSEKKKLKKKDETINALSLNIERKKLIIFIENFGNFTNSRAIIAEIKSEKLLISSVENIQDLHECLSIHYFDYNTSITFVTIEKFCIKMWKIYPEKLVLENRIHSKEEISETYLNIERNMLYFVTNKNLLNVMNHNVSNLFYFILFFT